MKSCSFTGHRKIKITPELIRRLKDTILYVVGLGVTEFYAGGSWGFDMLCEQTVIEMQKEYSTVKLHLILPCPPEEQTKGWNATLVSEYKKILEYADSVTVLSEHYTDECMKKRNARLVELADYCICYCTNRRSGTGQTVRMAENKGIPVINIANKT